MCNKHTLQCFHIYLPICIPVHYRLNANRIPSKCIQFGQKSQMSLLFYTVHCTLYSTEPSVVKRMLYNYSRCMKKIKSVLYSHNTCIIQYELKVILEAVRKITCVVYLVCTSEWSHRLLYGQIFAEDLIVIYCFN